MHSLPTSFHIQDSFHVLISVIYNHILKLCLYLSRCLFRSTNAFHLLTYSTCSFYLLQVQCFPKYVVSFLFFVSYIRYIIAGVSGLNAGLFFHIRILTDWLPLSRQVQFCKDNAKSWQLWHIFAGMSMRLLGSCFAL